VRDQAKLIGGYGVCGRQLCCAGYLRGFNPVSMKMARTQNLPINPGKLSGACGRLKCCLEYEYENYAEQREGLVDPGTRVRIDGEELTVGHIDILQGRVLLHEESGKRREMSKCEFCRSGYEVVFSAYSSSTGGTEHTPHPEG
jgi:cell fate regulator YaaT (PSP1 superfamily)